LKVSEFLELYRSQSTRNAYKTFLKEFLYTIYPSEGDIDELSERFISEKRDYQSDILQYFKSIKDQPPKTIVF